MANGSKDDPASPPGPTPTPQVIELLEEVLRVSKRTIEIGTVRVAVVVDTEERQISERLWSHRVEVEHVAVGRQLAPGEAVPQSRTEGDVLIVPMVEEVMVVEKRLVITEELHIRMVHEDQQVEQTVQLRRQRAVIDRLPPGDREQTA